jgi:hypothetical protein
MEIAGYENYLIYEDGLIYSKVSDNFLKTRINKHGYESIDLRNKGIKKQLRIHRLVAKAYIDNPDNKPCVDHIDRNKLNNDVSNLRWATHSENMKNLGTRSDNKLGEKYIKLYEKLYIFVYQTTKFYKSFKTLEEAVEFRDNYLSNLNL